MKLKAAVLFLLLFNAGYGQESATTSAAGDFSEAIEDNSFFIEEAYNQEPRVVQHIFNGTYFSSPQKDVLITFTQEWPLGSQNHQFSFTIPYAWVNNSMVSGVADLLINYRYQVYSSDDWAAFAPRISMVIPTGSVDKGLGMDVVGVQINLPLSKRVTEYLAAHVNLGATLMPGVKGTNGTGGEVKRTLLFFNAGASAILLVSSHFNIMLEGVMNFLGEIGTNGEIERSVETTFSPGIRYAIDVDQLQIVPGFAVPMVFSEGKQRTGMFFYLSFEHPF